MRKLLVILHAVWLGMHITVGYVVAPLLFGFAQQGMMTKLLAGNIAGELFHWVMYWGLFVSVCWWLLCRSLRQPSKIIPALIALLVVSEWVVTPAIEAIKTKQHHVLVQWTGDTFGWTFGVWHGISSVMYLFITLLLLIFTWQRLQIDATRR